MESSRAGEEFQDVADRLSHALVRARALGATSAEASASVRRGLSLTVRHGEVDTIQHHANRGLKVTVHMGQRTGSASSSDWRPEALQATVRAACDIARHAAEDACAGLPESNDLAARPADLDLDHPWSLTPEEAIERACRCEATATSHHPEIVNSDGATLASQRRLWVLANTHGFMHGFASTRHSLVCRPIGERNGSMQRGDWFSVARAPSGLESEETVGRRAAARTVDKLGARRLGTRSAPVMFAPEVARGLLAHFVAAVSGGNLYRRSSFLIDALGTAVFPPFLRLSEKPHLNGALGSAPFDAEGVATRERDIVAGGVLEGYFLSSYSARRLGMTTSGNAGGVHNLVVEPGTLDFEGMLEAMGTGLLVTELMGQGVNLTTGNYSRGASGFWVENGSIVHPVDEVTIGGNLCDMYRGILEVGRDVDVRGNIRCGSILVEEMAVAGQ